MKAIETKSRYEKWVDRATSPFWLLLLLTLPALVEAQDYTYTINNGTITITRFACSGGALTIPSTIDGLPVTRIGAHTFYLCRSLTSVTIPDSVISIGAFAFDSCRSLTSITIPNSVTSIGESAFHLCSSLASVTIPDSVTSIGDAAFDHCTNLTSVTIPSSVSRIGLQTFSSCTSLTSMTIPNSVTSIGDSAFSSCTSLTSITIPNSVTRIGDSAFSSCTGLTSVTIGNGVTSTGQGTFTGCTGLTSVSIPNSVTRIGDSAFSSCTSLTSITIPNSVTRIGVQTFYFCTSLTSVTIPNPLASIGDGAFWSCTSLTSVTIGSVTSIGREAFSGTSLSSVTILAGVISVGDVAFWCRASVTIGNSVTSIRDGAFSGCTSLTAITVDALNSTYSSVDGVLFNKSQTTLIQCPGGKAGSYTIPNSVTSIRDGAFSGCTSLTAITVDALNSAYSSVDGVLFNKSQTALIQCPAGKAGSYMIPNSVTTIGDGAFLSCSSLTSVTIPKSITSIGDGTFSGCTNLKRVYFEGDSPGVGSSVFDGNVNATVYYLQGTTGWGPTFDGLPAVPWNPQVPYTFTTNDATTTITEYIGSDGAVTIPSLINGLPVTAIGDGAFASCSTLTNVTIPTSVTSIGFGAFYSCSSVTGLYFQGDAPVLTTGIFGNPSVFDSASIATVYYLPGTTGWDTAFGGRPTALWKPQVQASDGSFGVRTNQFGFTITWASGLVFVVEACTDLANPIWSPVETSTLTGDSFYFSDPQWTNYPGRFYRLRDNGQTTVPVAAQSGVATIAAGGSHTVALKTDGSVVTWGRNVEGQTSVPVAAQSGVTAIAAGSSHTVALSNDGSVVAWGRNVEGQTTVPAGLSGVTAIAAGGYHTVALKNDGSVVAWGYNGNGQTTVPVAAQSGVTAIAAGYYYTVALKNDGSLVTWGDNEWGQTTVPGEAQTGVTAIAAGVAHTVALKTDGSVVVWGKNFYGQVTGTPALAAPYSTTASPVTLGGQVLSGVTAIAAGGYHTVALKSDGSAVSWGHNGYGQVSGTPTTDKH